MMKFGLPLLVLVILGSAFGEEEAPTDMCHIGVFTVCDNPTFRMAINSLNGMPDEAFLRENCNHLIQQLDCYLETDKFCPLFENMTQKVKGFRGLIGIKRLAVNMCDENSSLRKEYIDTIDCLNTHLEEIGGDFRKASSVLTEFKSHHDLHDPEPGAVEVALLCIKVSFLLAEAQNSVERHCGTEALNTARTMLEHIVSLEPDICAADEATVRLYTEMFESFRSEEESVASNSVD